MLMNEQGQDERCAASDAARKTISVRWRPVRFAEIALLVIGLICAAIFVAARLESYFASRAAIEQFERSMRDANPIRVADDQTPAGAEQDFSGWSEKRVRSYAGAVQKQLGIALAVLEIPRIQLKAPVFDGTDELTLNHAVGLIEGTAWPGESANVAIAGHRDGFFRKLKGIRLGDQIELETRRGTDVYAVNKIQIVTPQDVSVLQSDGKPSLTLVTCYPFYSIGAAPKRFVVKAHLKHHSPAGFAATESRPEPQPLNPALEEQ